MRTACRSMRIALPKIELIVAILPDLTDEDLKELGVLLGDRRRILRLIAERGAKSAVPRRLAPASA